MEKNRRKELLKKLKKLVLLPKSFFYYTLFVKYKLIQKEDWGNIFFNKQNYIQIEKFFDLILFLYKDSDLLDLKTLIQWKLFNLNLIILFLIFLDELESTNLLVLEKLRINNYLVSQFKLFDYEELVLMSRFKCFIIENSSFTRWGTLLSNFLDKIVIAPRIWFNNKKMRNINGASESWIKV
jgi:hypothetical protein